MGFHIYFVAILPTSFYSLIRPVESLWLLRPVMPVVLDVRLEFIWLFELENIDCIGIWELLIWLLLWLLLFKLFELIMLFKLFKDIIELKGDCCCWYVGWLLDDWFSKDTWFWVFWPWFCCCCVYKLFCMSNWETERPCWTWPEFGKVEDCWSCG